MIRTESRNPKTMHIDKMDTLSMVKVINEENMYSVQAIDAALPDIAKAVDMVAEAFKNGGRLIYVGCGTSGRLAVADAAECPPTFGVEYGMAMTMSIPPQTTAERIVLQNVVVEE